MASLLEGMVVRLRSYREARDCRSVGRCGTASHEKAARLAADGALGPGGQIQ